MSVSSTVTYAIWRLKFGGNLHIAEKIHGVKLFQGRVYKLEGKTLSFKQIL